VPPAFHLQKYIGKYVLEIYPKYALQYGYGGHSCRCEGNNSILNIAYCLKILSALSEYIHGRFDVVFSGSQKTSTMGLNIENCSHRIYNSSSGLTCISDSEATKVIARKRDLTAGFCRISKHGNVFF
jgi:predicted secreted Zn-dependent protease